MFHMVTKLYRSLASRHGCLLVSFAICAVSILGCNRGPTMHEVSGHVFFKDGTVPQGGIAVVVLQPRKDSTAQVRKGASGAIRSDGSFELWTKKQGDGVFQGEYQVAFTVLKAPMDPKPLIVEKYTRPETSGYEVTVDRDISDLKFEIEPLPGVKGAPPAAAN